MQHDMNIANQGFPAFRADLNDALGALVSNSSGATAPATTFAHMLWVDTAANPSVLKIRNADNDAWVTIGSINQTDDKFKLTPADGVSTDTISELTSAAGVTIDGVLLKDSGVNGLTVGLGAGSVSTNTAVGASALAANTTGANNTAVGYQALDANTTGAENTAVGYQALYLNTTGVSNSAFGWRSLYSNTTGIKNIGLGYRAAYSNSTGSNNTAIGWDTLYANTTGLYNTAVGYQAGYTNAQGSANTFLGYQAGYSFAGSAASTYNTFLGYSAGYSVTTGTKNTIIGTYSGNQGGLNISTASNYIVLSDGDGNPRCFINQNGSFYSPRIYADTGGASANVVVAADGQVYRSTSSLRYKNTIQNTIHGLAEVMQLRPVTYKSNSDGDTVFGGLIAEEVHEAGLTEFVSYNNDGEPDALHYGNMVSLAFKAIQELSAQVTALQAEVNTLKGQ